MRAFIFLSFVLTCNSFCFAQLTKEEKFNAAIKQVVLAFSRQDNAAVSKLINKKAGLYQLYSSGVFYNFKQLNTINFSDAAFPSNLLCASKGMQLLALSYSSLPLYSCEKETWSKKGVFVDTTKVDHMLSKICLSRNKNVPDNIPQQKIKFYYTLESKSRRLVLQDRKGKALVFYLTWMDGNWFLTIIDNVSSDCSA